MVSDPQLRLHLPQPFRSRTLDDGSYILDFESLASTQDEALARLRAGETSLRGVRAAYQSAGRGRRGARWIAPPGTCLLVTYILSESEGNAIQTGHLAFSAALAVCAAVESQAGLAPLLKWPNDVLLDDRKAAGVLVEVVRPPGGPTAALVGIGLNVNVEMFPEDLTDRATSLLMQSGRRQNVDALEDALRAALHNIHRLSWSEVMERWRARDSTAGRRYRATVEGQEAEGIAVRVNDDGSIMLRLASDRLVNVLSAVSVPTS